VDVKFSVSKSDAVVLGKIVMGQKCSLGPVAKADKTSPSPRQRAQEDLPEQKGHMLLRFSI
jgi:hypothetical protein